MNIALDIGDAEIVRSFLYGTLLPDPMTPKVTVVIQVLNRDRLTDYEDWLQFLQASDFLPLYFFVALQCPPPVLHSIQRTWPARHSLLNIRILSLDLSHHLDDQEENFPYFLSLILKYSKLDSLIISHASSPIFAALERHPPANRAPKVELRYSTISDEDMLLLGPSFNFTTFLVWHMNSFDEALYDSYVEPYFAIQYENDDGWYPGCEIWGDGQLTQDKNSWFYS